MFRHARLVVKRAPRLCTALSTASAPVQICYITDVEGNYRFWREQVAHSHGVLVRDGADDGLQLAHDAAHFVFGGDVFDHGAGDLRIAAELVALKRRYPTRVHLLIGNRDVNKLRLAAELHDSDVLHRDINSIPGPFWLAGTPGDMGPAEYAALEEAAAADQQAAGLTHATTSEAVASPRTARLRWMLSRTMGCPQTFEFRREELALLRGCAEAAVTDEDVTASFVASVATSAAGTEGEEAEKKEGGEDEDAHELLHRPVVLEYLELATLAVALGNTLFVHGAVADRSAGFVPNPATRWADNSRSNDAAAARDCRAEGLDVHAWLAALDSFKAASLAQWRAAPLWDAARTRRGGEALLAYAHRAATGGRSCMVTTFLNADGTLPATVPDHGAAGWLAASGIERVVVGHKPVGQSPIVLRGGVGGSGSDVEIVMGDTRYSDPRAADGRGCARSAVTIEGPSLAHNRVRVSGLLNDGRTHAFLLPSCGERPFCDAIGDTDTDAFVGRRLSGDWLVRTRLDGDGDHGSSARYMLSRNYAEPSAPHLSLVEYGEATAGELLGQLAGDNGDKSAPTWPRYDEAKLGKR